MTNLSMQGVLVAKREIFEQSQKPPKTLVPGAFDTHLRHSQNVINVGHGNVISSVTSSTETNFEKHGILKHTDCNTNLAITGLGWFVGLNERDETVLTRNGNFTPSGNNGELINSEGLKLLVQRLDENGYLPQNAGKDTLVPFAYSQNRQGDCRETTSVKISANLNSKAKGIKGSGQEMKISSNSKSNKHINNPEQLIIPEDSEFGAITEGTEMTIGTGIDEVKVTYGGITISKSANKGLFGVYGQDTVFKKIINDKDLDGLELTVRVTNRNEEKLRFNAQRTGNDKEFDSLTSLKAALNKLDGVKAEITSNGQLIVGSENGNDGIEFISNVNGFLEELGIQTIQQAAANEKRWNSLNSLRDHLAASGRVKAEAKKDAIDVFARYASDTIKFSGTSQGWHNVRYAHALGNKGAGDATGNANLKRVTITSPAHGLKTEDVIKLDNFAAGNLVAGAAGPVFDPFLMVKVEGDDKFSVYSQNDINTGHADNILHQISAGDFKWKKIIHKEYPDIKSQIIGVANNGGNLQITVGANHGIATNDIIFLETDSDTGNARSGYCVANVAGNVITINGMGGGGNIGQGNIKSLRVVQRANAAGPTYAADGSKDIGFAPIAIPQGAGDEIKVYVPKNFGVQDHISFSGLTAGRIYDHDTNKDILENDKLYEITGRGDGWVTIKVSTFTSAHAAAAGGADQWVHFTYGDGGGASGIGQDFAINRFTSFAKFFGLNDSEKVMEQAYDPNSSVRSLRSGKLKPRDDQSIFNNVVKVYKKDGEGVNLNLGIVKTSDKKWDVEIYTQKNSDGSYDVVSNDGLIACGSIIFDSDGTVENISSELKKLVINFTDGTTSIIDLELDKTESGNGIKQIATRNELISRENNGMEVGFLRENGVKVGDNGIVYYSYDNGNIKPIYQIPVAHVNDASQLKNVKGGYFTEKTQWDLKSFNVSGMGTIHQSALEYQPLESEESLATTMQASEILKTAASIVSTDKNNKDYLFQKV